MLLFWAGCLALATSSMESSYLLSFAAITSKRLALDFKAGTFNENVSPFIQNLWD